MFFPIGPALLGYLSEADLIPTFVLMDQDDKYRCLAEPPIILQKTGNRDEDLAVRPANPRSWKSLSAFIPTSGIPFTIIFPAIKLDRMIFWIASIAGFALFALNEIASPRGALLGKVLWRGNRPGILDL